MTQKRVKVKTINNQELIGTGNISVSTFSGSYNDLSNKPSIPSKTSDLNNDGADGTNVFVANNDSRLSDARTPTSHTHTSNQVTDLIDIIYPVGSIYMSVSNTSPSILFGGTWEQIKDKFLLSSGDTYNNGATGGEATHQLTERELPSDVVIIKNSSTQWYGANLPNNSGWRHLAIREHYEGQTYNQPHNNMPPYLVVNVWKRTA